MVGHSLGGGAVTVAAGRHPEAVAGVVGIGCTFPVGRGAAWGAHLYRAFGAWMGRPGPIADRLTYWLFHRMLPAEVADATIAGGLSGEAVTAVTNEVMGVDWLAEAARLVTFIGDACTVAAARPAAGIASSDSPWG